jgi:hypothetical protein
MLVQPPTTDIANSFDSTDHQPDELTIERERERERERSIVLPKGLPNNLPRK